MSTTAKYNDLMDPLTLANAFATIVQLIGVYKQENPDPAAADQQKFHAWLDYHHHEEIKTLICNTAAIQAEVINLLRQDSAATLAKLDSINNTLATLLSQVEEFKGLSKVLMPSAELSDQAVSILSQLVASNSRNLIYGELPNGAVLQPEDGEPFFYSNHLFLSDDIDTLERCGLLTQRECSSSNLKLYGITRAGAKYIETVGVISNPNQDHPTTPREII